MSNEERKNRSHLPMPTPRANRPDHVRRQGSGHEVPANRAVAPTQGRAQRPDHPDRRCRVRFIERLRRPVPDAERGETGGRRPEVQPLPHHRPLLADAAGAADRAQSSLRWAWAASPRLPPARPAIARCCPIPMSPLARTLKLNGYSTAQFGKCHEVPVWETSPVGPFDAWPTGGGGFEYFYGFIGGEANQWYPTLYEGTTPVEPKKTPEEGYHFMEDMTDKAIAWIAQQKALGARQALLRLLRARRDPRASSCSEGVGRQVQGQVRPGLGQAARRDLRAAEETGRHSAGLRTHRAPQGDSGVGRHAGGAEAHPAPPDGGLRRLHGVHRPPRRPPDRQAEETQHPRRHARLLHHRRQRRLGRRHAERRLQRDGQLQRPRPRSRRRSF